MNTVTQKMKFRQFLIKYAEKYGVTKAAIKYTVSRQYVYLWKKQLSIQARIEEPPAKVIHNITSSEGFSIYNIQVTTLTKEGNCSHPCHTVFV